MVICGLVREAFGVTCWKHVCFSFFIRKNVAVPSGLVAVRRASATALAALGLKSFKVLLCVRLC